MKQLIVLLTLCAFSTIYVNAQDYYHDVFGNARKYDVNVTYQPSLPVFYASMLTEKKRQYDEGLRRVQDKITELGQLPGKLWGEGNVPQKEGKAIQERFEGLIYVLNHSNIDYSDYSQSSSAMRDCTALENYIYKAFRESKD